MPLQGSFPRLGIRVVLTTVHLEDGPELPPHHIAARQPVPGCVVHIDVLLECGQFRGAEQLARLALRSRPGTGSHLADGGPAECAVAGSRASQLDSELSGGATTALDDLSHNRPHRALRPQAHAGVDGGSRDRREGQPAALYRTDRRQVSSAIHNETGATLGVTQRREHQEPRAPPPARRGYRSAAGHGCRTGQHSRRRRRAQPWPARLRWACRRESRTRPAEPPARAPARPGVAPACRLSPTAAAAAVVNTALSTERRLRQLAAAKASVRGAVESRSRLWTPP